MLDRWSESTHHISDPTTLTASKIKSFKQDPIVLSFYHYVAQHNLRKIALKKLNILKEERKTSRRYEDLLQ